MIMAKYNAEEAKKKKIEEEAKKLAEKITAPIISEYKEKAERLDQKEKDLNSRETNVLMRENSATDLEKALNERKQNQENEIAEAKKQARIEAENAIRDNEDEIRKDEYQRLIATGEEKAEEIRSTEEQRVNEAVSNARAKLEEDKKNLEADQKQLEQDRRELTAERQKAADAYQEAQRASSAASQRLLEGMQDIHNQQQKLSDDFEKKHKDMEESYQTKVADLSKRSAELDIRENDLAEDNAYVQKLKKAYSPDASAKALMERISLLEQQRDSLDKLNNDRADTILDLTNKLDQSTPADNETAASLRKQLEDAESLIVSMPSEAQIKELEAKADSLEKIKVQLQNETDRRIAAERLVDATNLSQRELEGLRLQAQALQALNEQLQQKLKFINDTYRNNRESKFAGLLEVDAELSKKSLRHDTKSETITTLPELVSHVRHYGASRKENPLYYSEKIIRAFIASLAASYSASRLLILQGLSGTGKSSLPKLFAEALGIDCFFVPVQPSWRDNRELLGYDNDFTNRFKETEFTKYLYRASQDQKHITLIVLDEMNLARIEYYFADFLSELESQKPLWTINLISNYSVETSDERPVALLYESGSAKLQVGKNVWFIGTANNDDSTATITDKVYDRAQILDMDERVTPFYFDDEISPRRFDLSTFETKIREAQNNKEFCLNKEDLQHIADIDNEYLKKMDITFGNRIETQLNQFVPVCVACGGTKEEAIDYYLAHKILRKLDERYDAYVADVLEELKTMLDITYGEGRCEESIRKIDTLLRRNFNRGEKE